MLDARFARLAGELIPTRDGLPSASEADPQGKWLARALAARPDLVPAYQRALGAPEARGLERSDPEAFAGPDRDRGRRLHDERKGAEAALRPLARRFEPLRG